MFGITNDPIKPPKQETAFQRLTEKIQTPDLFRCAYLLTQGGHIQSTHYTQGQVTFHLTSPTIATDDLNYRTGQARVDPLQLREAINYLRDQVRNRQKIENRSTSHAAYPRTRTGSHQTRLSHPTPSRSPRRSAQTPG